MTRRVTLLGSLAVRDRMLQDAISRQARSVDDELILSYGDPKGYVVGPTTYEATIGEFVPVDPTGGAITVQLPGATTENVGQAITVVSYSASNTAVTVQAASGQTINGLAAVTIGAGYFIRQFVLVTPTLWLVFVALNGSTAPSTGGWEYLPTTNPTGAPAPTSVWQFDGTALNGTDRMGNAIILFDFATPPLDSKRSPTEGLGGHNFSQFGGTDMLYSSTRPETAFNTATGALTMETLLSVNRDPGTGGAPTTRWIMGMGQWSGTAGWNPAFALGVDTNRNLWSYGHGNGTPVTYYTWNSRGAAMPGHPQLVTITRDSAGTGIKMYLDGELADSTTLGAAPSNISGGRFQVGVAEGAVGDNTTFYSIRITVGTEFTAAQVLEGFNQTRGLA